MELQLIPRISEKSYAEAQNGMFVFDVPGTANKQQIAAAVAAQYGVTVVDVNTTIQKGKVKRTYRKGGSPVIGKRTNSKKAYVRLAEGQTIPGFSEENK